MRRTVLAALAFASAVAGASPLTGTLPVKNPSQGTTNQNYSFDEKEKRVFAIHNFGVEIC